MASGSGNSKKQAKHAAARAMLDMLDMKEGLYHGSSSVTTTTTPTGPVSIAVAAQVGNKNDIFVTFSDLRFFIVLSLLRSLHRAINLKSTFVVNYMFLR
jgi:hypothetical protein